MNLLQSWVCDQCNTYNDGLRDYCVYCSNHKPAWITSKLQAWWEIKRGIFLSYGIYATTKFQDAMEANKSMTKEEELFSKFFNHEKILVSSMTDDELRSHFEELKTIAFEAKSRVTAADEEQRERRAKSGKKEWLATVDNSVVVSDAINGPKLRQQRMSKMDKLQQQLLSAGIDEDTVKEMIRNMETKATDRTVKAVTFNRKVTETTAVAVKTTNSEPFNPSSLKFGE